MTTPESTPPKRGRGRPKLPDDQRKPRKSGPSGKHKPPDPEIVARLRALLRVVDPLDVRGDKAVTELAPILGVKSGQLSVVLAGTRSVSAPRLASWEATVKAWAEERSKSRS
jgi:hypothetical protein